MKCTHLKKLNRDSHQLSLNTPRKAGFEIPGNKVLNVREIFFFFFKLDKLV